MVFQIEYGHESNSSAKINIVQMELSCVSRFEPAMMLKSLDEGQLKVAEFTCQLKISTKRAHSSGLFAMTARRTQSVCGKSS